MRQLEGSPEFFESDSGEATVLVDHRDHPAYVCEGHVDVPEEGFEEAEKRRAVCWTGTAITFCGTGAGFHFHFHGWLGDVVELLVRVGGRFACEESWSEQDGDDMAFLPSILTDM